MADFKFANNEIRDRSGVKIGSIYNQDIRDKHSVKIGAVYGQEVRNRHSVKVGSVYGQEIRDRDGRKLLTVSDARKEIEGTSTLDPVYLAALWFCFVKRGL